MGFKIGWNDGHTLTGIGTGAAGIIKETDRNRIIGSKARYILQNEYENVEIINCTIDNSDNDMREAVNKANAANVDLFVSNHVNAGGGYGFEAFYSRKSNVSNIEKAKIIFKYLADTKSCMAARRCCDDFSYRGYDFYVLINTKMDAILFEIGFVDNKECVNTVNCDEVARAYANGIAAAYGLKSKNIIVNTPAANLTSELYRIRKSWGDSETQKGAYSNLQNAKNECDKNKGYFIFDTKGLKVYPTSIGAPIKPLISNNKYLNLNPAVASWRVYPLNKPAIIGNEVGMLAPANYGGITYAIFEDRGDIKIIDTSYFGRVQIYAPADNDSSITSSPIY